VAESDWDTNLRFEQVPFYHQPTSSSEIQQKMNTRQQKYADDLTDTQFIQTSNAGVRRYYRFLLLLSGEKEQNKKKEKGKCHRRGRR
jgi:hypothetical protein